MTHSIRKLIAFLLLLSLCLTQAGAMFAYAETTAETPQATETEAEAAQNTAQAAENPENAETSENTGTPEKTKVTWPGLGADIKAGSAIVMDADTHQILWGKDIHAKRYPASITKLLTALIVLDRCSLDEQVTFSAAAVNNLESGAVTIGTVPGDVLSVKDCLYALLLKSANEVANALAEHVSGSISDFAALMNLYAEELGCQDSDFHNPSGLTDPNHVTSAYDMALIGCACMDNEDFMYLESEPTRKLAGTIKYPDGLTVTIGHKMRREGEEYYDERVVAGKTGFTSAAGNTLVTMAEDGGRRIVVVVLKDSSPAHYTDTKALIDYGLDEFTLLEPTVDTLEETFGLEQMLVDKGLVPASDRENGAYNTLSLSGTPKITVPAGAGIGDVTVNIDGKLFAGTAEDESGSGRVPENAVAKLTLSCADSNGRTVYILNERTEPESENSEITLLGGGNNKKENGTDGDGGERKGLGLVGWITFILLLTAAGFVAVMYFRKRAADRRREARRRKRLERMDRIDAKEAAAGTHRRKSRTAPGQGTGAGRSSNRSADRSSNRSSDRNSDRSETSNRTLEALADDASSGAAYTPNELKESLHGSKEDSDV